MAKLPSGILYLSFLILLAVAGKDISFPRNRTLSLGVSIAVTAMLHMHECADEVTGVANPYPGFLSFSVFDKNWVLISLSPRGKKR